MIVNHFNTFPYGGAATAALRLHGELKNQHVDSRFLFANNDRQAKIGDSVRQIQWQSADHTVNNLILQHFEKRRVRQIHRLYNRHLTGRNPAQEVFSMASLTRPTIPANPADVSGIVHLHWIAFMADYRSFFGAIPNRVPIVWTLHDMNPITGGCHYSGGCHQFKRGCGHCGQILKAGPDDVSRQSFETKQKALRRRSITVVAPSLWLKRLAESSPVFPPSTTYHHIRLGFDLKQLYPLPKLAARKKLGINTEATLIGFGAESVNNHRKGLDLLLPALAKIKNESPIECLAIGSGDIDNSKLDLPKIHSLGYLNDPQMIAQFYSACDLIVVPSREDNQPQVGLEAMACGTPVVAFDIGGISEYVLPGITGWLAKPESSIDLANQIRKLVTEAESRANLSDRCRRWMEQEFDIARQAEKYLALYQRLIDDSQRRAA